MPPEQNPDHYPWTMIKRLKALTSISPNDRACNYLLPLFKGWSLTHEDHIPRDCLCGERNDSLSNFKKTVNVHRQVQVSVGNHCGCAYYFRPGMAQMVEGALDYLCTHAVYVAYVGETQRDRHKFEILPTNNPHPLFDNEEVVDYLKNIYRYFFVDKYAEKVYIEVRLCV